MAEPEYLNFDLLLENFRDKYRARVLDSPVGQAICEFEMPFSELEIENFYLKVGRPRRGMRKIDTVEMLAAKTIGNQLFKRVFKGDVYTAFLSSLFQARNLNHGLRIRLRVDAPELSELPWEYLYSDIARNFLSLSIDTPIIRYIDLVQPPKTLTTKPPIRILTMISGPTDYPLLDVEREWEKLQAALSDLQLKRLIKVDRLEKCTLSELQRQLRRADYHVFHFIGHGGFDVREQDGFLVIEKDNGRGQVLNSEYLGTILHNHAPLRLVVLNACEGARTSRQDPFAGTAQSLVHQGIPAVIAMQFEITDNAAITFAEEFYSAISDGYPIDSALSEARMAIFAQGNDIEWGTPVYFTRAPDGKLFSLEQISASDDNFSEKIQTGQIINDDYLNGLYLDGLKAYVRKDWEKATKRFEAIFVLRRDYEDVQDKLIEMRLQLQNANQIKHDDLKDLYLNALKAMVNETWLEAEHFLLKIKETRYGYLDTEQYLQKVQSKIKHSKIRADKPQKEFDDKTSTTHETEKAQKSDVKIFTTLPSTISIETVGGVSTPIFYKGDMLPLRHAETFTTAKDNQTNIEVHLVLGENKKVSDNISLGKVIMDRIPPALKGIPQIEIFFVLGRDLKLETTAIDRALNRTKNISTIELAGVKSPPIKDPLPAKSPSTQSSKQNVTNDSFDDLFDEIFNNYSVSRANATYSNAQSKNTPSKRGEDTKFQVNLTLEEVATGVEKKVTFDRYEVCGVCLGSGKNATDQCNNCQGKGRNYSTKLLNIRIPAGVDTGTKIKYPFVGHCGENGGARGDVYAIVSVSNHDIFTRNKSDINIRFPITKRFASQGGVVRIPALKKGLFHELKISKNTKEHSAFVLKNAGIPHLNKKGRGNIIVVLDIYDPRNISLEIRGLLNRINKYLESKTQT